MEIKFIPGDSVVIRCMGGNNSRAPEHSETMYKGDTVYTVSRIETEGVYRSGDDYTIILNTGNPVWAFCLKKVESKTNFPIF